MVIGAKKFNLYFWLAALACLTAGCMTGKDDKKPLAAIQLHIETLHDGTSMNKPVPIYRANPILVNVETDPFLTESDLTAARLIETNGAFMIRLRFNEMGTSQLEETTEDYPSKHFAIYCAWGPKLKETRWLAAPQIRHRISNGVVTFTPDATREESQLIVDSLNNAVAQKKKDE